MKSSIRLILVLALIGCLGWSHQTDTRLYFPLVLRAERATSSLYLPLVLQQAPRPALRRALWISRFDWTRTGVTPTQASLVALITAAADAGFSDLFFQVRGQADAFYRPGLEPWSARLTGSQGVTLGRDPGWDPLAVALDTAHARGMAVHAWVNVYPVWLAPANTEPLAPPQGTEPEHLFNRLTYSAGGGYGLGWTWRVYSSITQPMTLQRGAYLWASPAVPQVQEHVLQVVRDLVTRYPLDGLHLDNVRYPGPGYSYDPWTLAAYANDPLSTTLSFADWQPDFQRAQVTSLVTRLSTVAKAIRSGLQVSAAAWPVYLDRWGWGANSGYADYYQDAQGWLQHGNVDGLLPMLYSALLMEDRDKWTLALEDYLEHSGTGWVWPGLAVTAPDGSCVPFDELTARITLAQLRGASGVSIFSAGGIDTCAYWDEFAALALGP